MCLQENCAILKELVSLRAQKSSLLGFRTHADYVLEMNMAKTSQAVATFLGSLSPLPWSQAPLGRSRGGLGVRPPRSCPLAWAAARAPASSSLHALTLPCRRLQPRGLSSWHGGLSSSEVGPVPGTPLGAVDRALRWCPAEAGVVNTLLRVLGAWPGARLASLASLLSGLRPCLGGRRAWPGGVQDPA